MAYDIKFDKRVVPELKNIVAWYIKQSYSAAEKFEIAFNLTLEVLKKGMIDYSFFTKEIRRASIPDFPYFIYYSRDDEEQIIFVHAILHNKLNPDFISKRLKNN